MDYCLALAQMRPKLGATGDNLTKIEESIEQGIQAKADLIIFPELALTGYFLADLVPEVALSLDSEKIGRLKRLSRHIDIVVGFVEVSKEYLFFNSAIFIEKGEIKHLHRKVYLPTYGLFDEHRYFAQGETFQAFDTKYGRFGLLICEDMWHLSSSYILALDGATTIVCLASSPVRGINEGADLHSIETWQRLTSTISIFLNCRSAFCNRVGVEDGITFWGGSEIVDLSGQVLSRGRFFEEDLIVTTLCEGNIRRGRIASPMLRDEHLSITLRELHRIDRESRLHGGSFGL